MHTHKRTLFKKKKKKKSQQQQQNITTWTPLFSAFLFFRPASLLARQARIPLPPPPPREEAGGCQLCCVWSCRLISGPDYNRVPGPPYHTRFTLRTCPANCPCPPTDPVRQDSTQGQAPDADGQLHAQRCLAGLDRGGDAETIISPSPQKNKNSLAAAQTKPKDLVLIAKAILVRSVHLLE